MAKKIIKARLKQRTDTQANWAANNPVLLEGELGLVTDDKNLYKVGDGATAWNDLPFRGFDGTLVHETGDSDNAAMSQRGVTRALAKLEENMANNEKIKELSGKIEQLVEENTRLKERIEEQDVFIEDLEYHKLTANSDNRYPDLSVGTADNLAGVDVVDSEFNFRRSGGGAITDGVARIEAIKGNSVVWNQMQTPLAESENIATNRFSGSYSNGVLTLTTKTEYAASSLTIPVRSYVKSIPNHVYLATAKIEGQTPSACIGSKYPSLSNGYVIIRADIADYLYLFPFGATSTKIPAGTTCKVSEWGWFDLTKMFGAGYEPTTIEEFYQRIPMGVDLNAYNEGEVIHMDVQSIESVGVNQWDEEWELGRIDVSTGNNQALYDSWRSKNFTEVIPNAEYYIKGGASVRILYYDKDFKFVDWWGCDPYKLATMPSNVRYVRLMQLSSTAYAGGISINLSDTSINGKYYPHTKKVEDLSLVRKYFPQGMKSAGSAHDAIRYNKASGKREYSKGRMKEVDMGSLTFSEWQDGMYAANLADMAIKGQILCANYSTDTYTNVTAKNTGIAALTDEGGIVIYDAAYTTPNAIKTALQGVILYYEAAEWEWEELDKEDQLKDWDYSVWNDGTERANAEGKSSAFAADLTYGFNAVGKIKELEGLVAQLRAKVGI